MGSSNPSYNLIIAINLSNFIFWKVLFYKILIYFYIPSNLIFETSKSCKS